MKIARIPLTLACLLLASPVLAQTPKNLGGSEVPTSTRCVTADGLSYESCAGTISVNGADGAITDGASVSIKATVKDYTNSNPLTTILVDTNGDPASVGGGTQYQQGTASTTTDTMTMAGCVRVDTPAVAAGVIDGDRARCIVDSTGRLWVHVGVIDGTVAATQSGTWNIGTLTSIANPVAVTGTFWQATQPISAASLPLPTGAATAANQDGIIKDGTGDTTQANVSSGALHVACQSGCSGGTQYAEDTAHSSGDQLTLAGVVRSDAAGALAADGDRTVLQVDSNGYLKVVNINPNLAADNSTLSTSKVPVLPGTVSTSAPTWTNGNQSALSLQTDGSVRAAITNTVTVSDGSGALNVICDSGCSGGTQYNQGTAGTATDTLSMAGAVRKDTAAADAGAVDGDRIVLSTDSVGRLRVTSADTTQPVSGTVSITANSAVNVAQINGVTPLMGAGNTGTGSPRVTIATDQAALVGMGVYVEDAAETAGGNLSMAGSVRRDTAASSAGTTGDNATINTDSLGRLWTRNGGPCADHARITSAVIDESTAATNQIVALNGSDLIYVCGYKWVTTAATSLSWKYGTGTDCATGTTAIEGPQPFSANGGVVENGGGHALFVVPAGNALCLTSSAATAHGGRVTYVRTAAP